MNYIALLLTSILAALVPGTRLITSPQYAHVRLIATPLQSKQTTFPHFEHFQNFEALQCGHPGYSGVGLNVTVIVDWSYPSRLAADSLIGNAHVGNQPFSFS
jgi:hypothetical protein